MNSDGASQILGYMNQHSLEQPIADAVCAAIKARAEQPLRHIAQSLLQECGDDPKEIELERLREETARLKAELALMQKARRGPEQAAGEAKGVQALNVAIYKLGALKHEPPRFEWFDPQHLEGKAALFKEIKLPFAAQTHEVCFDPVTRCVFVSQMTNSVLVRIPVGPDGLLLNDQDAWRIGEIRPRPGLVPYASTRSYVCHLAQPLSHARSLMRRGGRPHQPEGRRAERAAQPLALIRAPRPPVGLAAVGELPPPRRGRHDEG